MNFFTRGIHRLTWTLSLLANYQPESIGGQAVIEGVLMRSPRRLAVAVRSPEGGIVVDNQEFLSFSRRHKLLALPVLRGAASLIEALVIGVRALNFSMAVQERKVGAAPAGSGGFAAASGFEKRASLSDQPPAPLRKKGEALVMGLSLLFSLGLALALFQLLPYFTAGHIVGGTRLNPANPMLFNLTAGGVRIVLLLGYMWGISHLKDIGRVFQYHGAEHKSIFAHEKQGGLTVAGAKAQSRFHPRCGTSFILIVAITCILFFSLLDGIVLHVFHYAYPSFLVRFLMHLPFVPVVAGLSFEVLKLTARFQDSLWVRPFILPGLWLQKITTREPDDKQLEVAIASIEAALA